MKFGVNSDGSIRISRFDHINISWSPNHEAVCQLIDAEGASIIHYPISVGEGYVSVSVDNIGEAIVNGFLTVPGLTIVDNQFQVAIPLDAPIVLYPPESPLVGRQQIQGVASWYVEDSVMYVLFDSIDEALDAWRLTL